MKVRIYGLLMIVAGILLTAAMIGLAIAIAQLIHSSGRILLFVSLWPVMLIFAGWLQLLSGLPFQELSTQFDASPPLKKIALSIIFVVSSIAFLCALIILAGRLM